MTCSMHGTGYFINIGIIQLMFAHKTLLFGIVVYMLMWPSAVEPNVTPDYTEFYSEVYLPVKLFGKDIRIKVHRTA
jgi:hypothetical protein